jgi:hypothetical protein
MDNPYLYYLGLDLGQARDYSALAIIEEQLYVGEAWANEVLYQEDYDKGISPGWVSPAALTAYRAGLALRGCYELWLGNGSILAWLLENHTQVTFPTKSGRSSPLIWPSFEKTLHSATTNCARSSTG